MFVGAKEKNICAKSYCIFKCTFLVETLVEGNVQRCSVKKVFLKNSQNSQENTCVRVSFLIKL